MNLKSSQLQQNLAKFCSGFSIKFQRKQTRQIPTFKFLDIEPDGWNNFSLPLFLWLKVIEQGGFAGIVETDDQHIALFLLQAQHVHQLIEQTHGNGETDARIRAITLCLDDPSSRYAYVYNFY